MATSTIAPPPAAGTLVQQRGAKPFRKWHSVYLAFVDANIPLDRLAAVHKKQVRKSAKRYGEANSKLFAAMSAAVVDGSAVLAVYKAEGDAAPIDLIDLREITAVSRGKVGKKATLVLAAGAAEKKLVFGASSAEEADLWEAAIAHRMRTAGSLEANPNYSYVYDLLVAKDLKSGVAFAPAAAEIVPESPASVSVEPETVAEVAAVEVEAAPAVEDVAVVEEPVVAEEPAVEEAAVVEITVTDDAEVTETVVAEEPETETEVEDTTEVEAPKTRKNIFARLFAACFGGQAADVVDSHVEGEETVVEAEEVQEEEEGEEAQDEETAEEQAAAVEEESVVAEEEETPVVEAVETKRSKFFSWFKKPAAAAAAPATVAADTPPASTESNHSASSEVQRTIEAASEVLADSE